MKKIFYIAVIVTALVFATAGCDKVNEVKEVIEDCGCSINNLTVKSTETLGVDSDVYQKFVTSDLFVQLPKSERKSTFAITMTSYNEIGLKTLQYQNIINPQVTQAVTVIYYPEEKEFNDPIIYTEKKIGTNTVYEFSTLENNMFSITIDQNGNSNISYAPSWSERVDNCMRSSLAGLDNYDPIMWAEFLANPPAFAIKAYASCAYQVWRGKF